MKKLLIALLCASSLLANAQEEKDKKKNKEDEVVYYEDSRVKKSRLSLALNLNPNWTSRRLINGEVPAGGGYDLADDGAKGSFQFNYGIDAFVRFGSALNLGVGFGKSYGDFTEENAIYYQGRMDTLIVDVNTSVSMYTVPIKLNFSTALNDAFDLEVIPQVQLNFVDSYQNSYTVLKNDTVQNFDLDLTDRTSDLIWSVGIALGGTFKIADNWGLFVRGDIKYMLSPLIEEQNYPRQTLLTTGLNLGVKYSF